MLTGKQRSYLKGLAQNLDPVVSIGKSGLSDTIRKAIDENLEANELVKVSIIGESELDPKEVCNQIAEELHAEFVQAIGKRFVLYRQAREKENRRIILPRSPRA